jgi:hypothetical protein
LHLAVCVWIVAPAHKAEDISNGERNEQNGDGKQANSHQNPEPVQALFRGTGIVALSVIAVVTSAISAAAADLAWAPATQPGLAFDLYAIANDRHNLL